ncbi:S-adenosyl-L-methionine-dependent methyltransferase [Aspergillus cavernicola]|uniref:Arsenite methyltransferase n=1 Tax=Aspergillus cavernicola TaxID=176166 RepID=A0ABR4I225_9EURO
MTSGQIILRDIAKRTTTTTTTRQDAESKIATAFGYTANDLSSLPEKTNLGLSCGNPVAHANLKAGETVVDLGSGGGIDVILAARKVGPDGRAIGIDMTNEMINLATRNAKKTDLTNISFIETSITSIPLPDSSVDCIISNCVINLVPKSDKPRVFCEIARLLTPGGRVALSDILAKRELPEDIVSDMALYVGCIAGADQVVEYREWLEDAGFRGRDLNLYKESSYLGLGSCCGSGGSGQVAEYADVDFNGWAGSFQIYAVKSDSG